MKVSAKEARALTLDGQEKIRQKLESDIAAYLEDIGHRIVQTAAQGRKSINIGRRTVQSGCWSYIKKELEVKHFISYDTNGYGRWLKDAQQVLSWLKQNGYNIKSNELPAKEGRVYTVSWTIS